VNNKKPIPTWVNLVIVVLCVGTIAVNIAGMNNSTAMATMSGGQLTVTLLSYIANVVALLFGTFYCISEFKKEFGKFLKYFLVASAVAVFFSALAYSAGGLSISLALYMLIFGFVCILSTAKDLGKKMSLIFTYSSVICSALLVVLDLTAGGLAIVAFSASFTMLLLSLIMLLMIYAKYADKATRGSK